MERVGGGMVCYMETDPALFIASVYNLEELDCQSYLTNLAGSEQLHSPQEIIDMVVTTRY